MSAHPFSSTTTTDSSSSASTIKLISSLPSPTGVTRAWQSIPHPSPRCPLLATASSDKSVHVWSLRDFRLLSTITGGHKRSVRCVGWRGWGDEDETDKKNLSSQRGKKDVVLATGSFDANVGVWLWNRDQEGAMEGKLSSTEGNDADVVASHHDHEHDHDHDHEHDHDAHDDLEHDHTHTHSVNDVEEEWHFSTLLTGPDSEIKSLAFCPPHYHAPLLATSSRDKSVWVWEEVEPDEWETIAVLQEHAGDVKCVAWCTGARIQDQQHGQEEPRIVGAREILASGSYDDTIRLWRDVEEEGDWACVGVLEGHGGTVWSLVWEPKVHSSAFALAESRTWDPRLASCSDDLSVRIWRRELPENEEQARRQGAPKLPSIIRPRSSHESWSIDAVLPPVHVRSVYAIDWSARTGLLVSCGGDGIIAVYREESATPSAEDTTKPQKGDLELDAQGDVVMNADVDPAAESFSSASQQQNADQQMTQWKAIAQIDGAHDEFEINHVCWALRKDKDTRFEGEEVLVSTGDDGVVKIWEVNLI